MVRMSALKDRLRADLTTAMKARDELRSSTIRMVLTSITNAEVAGDEARELSDDEVLKVVAKEAKKRKEAAVAYEEARRPELAATELAELDIIAAYLPAALTPDELTAIITAAVATAAAAGQTGPSAMGSVMKIVQPQVAGRADGGAVAAAVKSALQ